MCLSHTALWEGEPRLLKERPSCRYSGVHGKWCRLHRHSLQEPGQGKGQGKRFWWAAAELWQRIHHPTSWPGPCIRWRIWKEEQTQVNGCIMWLHYSLLYYNKDDVNLSYFLLLQLSNIWGERHRDRLQQLHLCQTWGRDPGRHHAAGRDVSGL